MCYNLNNYKPKMATVQQELEVLHDTVPLQLEEKVYVLERHDRRQLDKEILDRFKNQVEVFPGARILLVDGVDIVNNAVENQIVFNEVSKVHAHVFNEAWNTNKFPSKSQANLKISLLNHPMTSISRMAVFVFDGYVVGGFSLNTDQDPNVVVDGVESCMKKIMKFDTNAPDYHNLTDKIQRGIIMAGETFRTLARTEGSSLINADELFLDKKFLKTLINEIPDKEINKLWIDTLYSDKGDTTEVEIVTTKIRESLKFYEPPALSHEEKRSMLYRAFSIGSIATPLVDLSSRLGTPSRIIFWTSPDVPDDNMFSMFNSLRLLKWMGRPDQKEGYKANFTETIIGKGLTALLSLRLQFPPRMTERFANLLFRLGTETKVSYIGPLIHPSNNKYLAEEATSSTRVLLGSFPSNDVIQIISSVPFYNALRFMDRKSWNAMIAQLQKEN